MSKNSSWLKLSGDRVLVDIGSPAESYWRGLGYIASSDSVLYESATPVEKPARKTRVKKVAKK